MEVLTLLAASFVLACVFFLRQRRRTPPGPIGLPIVGYLPFLTSKPYVIFQKLGEKFGPVFSVRLGSRNVIILNDFQSMRDAFLQDAFMGRPPESPFPRRKTSMEIGSFNGLAWKGQRRFSLHVLRDLGFGKSRMEDMMKEEIGDLLQSFEATAGRPMSPNAVLAPSMSNNIAMLVYGKRRKYDDPVRIAMDKNMAAITAAGGQVGWRVFFPWTIPLLQVLRFGKETKLQKIHNAASAFRIDEIEEHKKTLNSNITRDFIDAYLMEIQRNKDPAFCEDALVDLIGTLFGAGSDTVLQAMDWLMLLMAALPDVQRKIQSEIEAVLGRDRFPTWTDHYEMRYTQATIMEVMRWRPIIPLNILRYTLWDTELNGYFIPKETVIVANIWAIHHDPKYWGKDVGDFRPDRFLTEDGKDIVKHEHFIPFSIGKRSCPGESYARKEVFVYFVAILQRFYIRLPEGAVPDFDGQLGIGLKPKPYEVCLTKR